MQGDIDWTSVENSSSENRELAGIIRQLEGLYRRDPSLDWAESRQRCAQALNACFAASDQNSALTSLLQGATYEVGGAEHYIVRVDKHPERVFKVTHGDSFGCYSYFSRQDPDLTGRNFHGSVNDDPIFYLQRWMLLNFVGGYQTRLEGLLAPEGGLRIARICVSQPTLVAKNPRRDEIRDHLKDYGFEWISEDAFLDFRERHPSDRCSAKRANCGGHARVI